MTAGHGIIHRELAYRDEHAHVLQLWLNLPAAKKLTPSRYQDLTHASMPRLQAPGVAIDVHAGTVGGVSGGADTNHSVQGVVVALDPQASYDLAVPAEHRLFAHVLSGTALIGGRRVEAGQIGWSDPLSVDGETSLRLAASDGDQPSRIMVYSGTPLREPVAFGGPFVMNDRREILQAFQDFHAGEFGAVPRTARLAFDR
jgi:redox-sensitive bicupin YhaK (pirin superfamily)